MDYILYGLLAFYAIKGYRRGAVATIFSLFVNFVALFVSYALCQRFSNILLNFQFFSDTIPEFVKNTLDNLVPGEFSNIQQISNALLTSQVGLIFLVFVKKLISNIDFEGNLTIGEAFTPSITNLLTEIASFLIIYFLIKIILKIIKIILNKIIKKLNLNFPNKIIGLILGVVEGLFLFAIIFVVLTVFSNLTFNEGLKNFVDSGIVSAQLYDFFLEKIINLFYWG